MVEFALSSVVLLLLVGGLQEGPCGGQGLGNPANQRLLDWDGNGTVNVSDALQTLQYLFQGGPPHSAGTACLQVAGCNEACASH